MYCVKFKDVFPFIKNGANIKQDANAGGIPITRIETLAGGEFNTSRLGYANIFDISPYYEYVLNSGDILMSHINSPEYLGRSVVFEDKYDIVIHGMNLLRLKANKEFIDSRYAVYLFNGNTFKEHIRKITKKSVNQASFSINDLKEIELQLPSIENQVIVAEKLDKLKMLIKKKNRLILFLDEMIKSRFVEMFGDPNMVALDKSVKFSSVAKIITGNTPSRKSPENYGDYIEWIKSDNIISTNLYISQAKEFLSEQGAAKGRVAPKDSLLMTCIAGSIRSIGNVGICDRSVAFNQQINAIVLKNNINPLYVYWLLKLFKPSIIANVEMSLKGIISKSQLENMLIPIIASQEEQELFIKFALQINKLKFA